MSLSTTIKTIQDIMRQDAGVDGDAQRISQLVWMIFLKIFDDSELEYELDPDYVSAIPQHLRWRNWAADDEGITGDALSKGVTPRARKGLTHFVGPTVRPDAGPSARGVLFSHFVPT